MTETSVIIERAQCADAEQILQLQYLSFQKEAVLYNDYDIPPLKQTLQELLAEYESHCILVARCDGELVGSVRANRSGDRCYIGRLIVHPKMQRKGIGTLLMNAVEREFQDVSCFELFTGNRSEGNLKLYKGLGYEIVRTRVLSPNLEMVFFEKRAQEKTGAICAGACSSGRAT